MIRYVNLVNYKSLVNLKVDFMRTKTDVKNFVLIYGENGIGKTNFASSFYTLNETMRTMSSIKITKKLFGSNDADLKDKEDLKKIIETKFKSLFKDIEMIIKDCKTIDSTSNMILEYGFVYNGKNGVYRIEMDDIEIVAEKLEYVLNKNQTYYFDLTSNSIKINNNIFQDKNYYDEFCSLLEKYWGKHSFLAILLHEIEDKKEGYVKNKIINNFYEVINYLRTLSAKIKGGNNWMFEVVENDHKLLKILDEGKISLKKEDELNKTEKVLNDFFTHLYSDIKKVYYEKEYKDNYICYKLFLKKNIYGKIIDVDFNFESTGTKNLLKLLPYFISACEGKTVIIDELDTGIHDLMITGIIENLTQFITGQMIITTHNTLLIESDFPNDNIYVFNVNRNADKELLSITEFNGRIHKNINPRKRYLGGMYGGIPILSDLDFDELLENLE